MKPFTALSAVPRIFAALIVVAGFSYALIGFAGVLASRYRKRLGIRPSA